MRRVFPNDNQCCGCSACFSICPKKAIEMRANEEGFLYPYIDEEKCINCNLCTKVCDFNKEKSNGTREFQQKVYAYTHNSKAVLNRSSSGGAFTAISDSVINGGGIVYGAKYGNNLAVEHFGATSTEERNLICGSKYVQSSLNGTFSKIKKKLNDGWKVLFTGTPCQVAGLISFLGKDYPNLFTIDIICHGVVSPMLFRDYLSFVEKKKKAKIIRHDCRGKQEGWCHVESNVFDNGVEDHTSRFSQLHRRLFYSNVSERLSCYECKYTSQKRTSDITIGDFWGIEKSHPESYDRLGVSLVIVNSSKGEMLFDSIRESGKYATTTIDEASERQPQLSKPINLPDNRQKFWEIYHKKGYYKAICSVFYRPFHEWTVDTLRKMGVFNLLVKVLKK